MRQGTKSLLFGVHAIWLHPFFVALAWWRVYGFPRHVVLWCAFFLHDIGYWGKPNLDGPEGKTHPWLGFFIMKKLFNPVWGVWTGCHSKSYAEEIHMNISQLYYADKLAMVLTPTWLYVLLGRMSGDIHEFMRTYPRDGVVSPREWTIIIKKMFRAEIAYAISIQYFDFKKGTKV